MEFIGDHNQKLLVDALQALESNRLTLADMLAASLCTASPKNAEGFHIRGVIAGLQSNHLRAEEFLREAAKLDKKNYFIVFNLAKSLSAQGKHSDSLEWHLRALNLDSKRDSAWINYGNSLLKLCKIDQALYAFDQALALDNKQVNAYTNKGICFHKKGLFEDALSCYSVALSIDKTSVFTLNSKATTLRAIKQLEAALEVCKLVVQLDPDYAEGWNTQGVVQHDLNLLEESLKSYQRAIELEPDYVEAWNNQGVALHDLNRLEESLSSYKCAIELKPDYAEAWNNQGNLLIELRLYLQAINSFDRAIKAQPNFADAYFNKSLSLLRSGNYKEGWDLYEWRWKSSSWTGGTREFSKPVWHGNESLQGKTILLHAEQGLGDTIQFSRYASLVKRSGAQVVLEVQAPLIKIFKTMHDVDWVIEQGSQSPVEFDFHCPLLSLPKIFSTTPESIPKFDKYLEPDPTKVRQFATIFHHNSDIKVGVAWSSTSSYKKDFLRSLSFTNFSKIFSGLDLKIYCLQKEFLPEDLESVVHADNLVILNDKIQDFSDTAAIASHLDLVISTCTSVPHLTCAMGIPTWILLSYTPDFRWMLGRNDSPWYPSATLFRQPKPGDWSGVLSEVNTALKKYSFR